MALTKTIEYDKIEIVGPFKCLQVRKATVIKEDGVEIDGSRSFSRYTLDPGTLDASDNFVDNPLDKEPEDVTPIPDDIKGIALQIISHRIVMKPEAKIRGITGMHIVRKILSEVPVPVIQQG